MTQTFDLKSMGFAEMKNEELEVVDGGFWGELAFGALCLLAPGVVLVGLALAATSANAY